MTENEILSYFANEGPTEEQQREADEFQPVYFFATDDRPNVALCSHCDRLTDATGHGHLEKCWCDNCGEYGTMVHLWRYRKNYIVPLRRNIMTYHLEKSPIDPDVVTCKAVYSMYEVFKDEVAITTTRVVDAWYAFIPGKGGYEVAYDRRWYPQWDHENTERRRSTRSRCTGRHNVYAPRTRKDTNVDVVTPMAKEWREVTQGQKLQYVCDFYATTLATKYSFIELMDKVARWPLAMEQIGKIGLGNVLSNTICNGFCVGRTFNMRGKNLESMLRIKLTHKDMTYIREHDGISLKDFQQWRTLKKSRHGKHLELMLFMAYGAGYYNETYLREALNHVTFERILNYLEKQSMKFQAIRIDLGLYADYIHDCMKLNINLNDKSVLFPGDLSQMHINLSNQIRYKGNEKLEKRYHKRYKKLLDGYSYQDDTYSIVVPDKVTDLIREGEVQHICVGMYVERVAKGETDVVYIRKNTALDASFCTMEIRNGAIVQVRAKHNEKPPADTMEFVEKFRREKLGKGA